MQPFTTHTANVAVLDRTNVDTDQVIPKQFLKRIERTGYGEFLFFDWGRLEDGSPNPDFELNAPQYQNAGILVTGPNFGCGSSREHAVWAIYQHGSRQSSPPPSPRYFTRTASKTASALCSWTTAKSRTSWSGLGRRGPRPTPSSST